MTGRATLLTAILTIGMGRLLTAQQATCQDSDTIEECSDRLGKRLQPPSVGAATTADADRAAAEPAREAQEDTLEQKLAGTTALGPGLSSSIGDFLPALAGALGFTPTTTDEGAAAFETNLRVPIGAAVQKVRLQVALRDAKLYEPLRQALPEATREERSAGLERELGDFDDVRLSLAWNYENRAFGRSFDSYRTVVDQLFQLERAEFYQGPDKVRAMQRRSLEAVARVGEIASGLSSDSLDQAQHCTFPPPLKVAHELKLHCLKQSVRQRLDDAIQQHIDVALKVEDELDDQLTRTGFYNLADLVNNQPQLTAEVRVDARRDLVGPNEFSGTLRYEAGFTNMNGLRRTCLTGQTTAISLDCLRRYARDPAAQAALKRGDRLFVTASFTRRQDYQVTLAGDAVSLDLEGTWDFTGEIGFGRYVAFDRKGNQIGRIDLSADYVHHQDDPNRQNRFVGNVTYTQKVGPALSLAAGVSYASRPEFLEEVQRKVTATFGLRYKLIND